MLLELSHEHAQEDGESFPDVYGPAWRHVLLATDALVAMLAGALAGGHVRFVERAALALLSCLAVLVTLALCGLYRRSFAVHARDEVYHSIAPAALAAIPFSAGIAILGQARPYAVLASVAVLVGGITSMRALLHTARRAHLRRPQAKTRALTPGAYQRAERMYASKRAFDVVVATIAMVVLSPIIVLVAVAIIAESGRPVFFRQDRVSRHGKTFSIFKFRTMRKDADSKWVRPGDARVTRLGAFLRRSSLDELPQLLNVLRGEMSIVGPRPEMRAFADDFALRIPHYEQRHVQPPGITGWAQLYHKRNLQPSDMPSVLLYDLFYVEHASRLLDTAIILKTAAEFLFHRAV
ncbi:MAG: sugar transferase [Vulcanimicrobiaceae bacterium]